MTRAKKKEEPVPEIEDVELPDLGWPPDAEFSDPPPPEKT